MATVKPYDTAAGRRYRVRYRRPDGRQTDKRGFKTRKAAELWEADNTVKMATGAWLSPEAGKTLLGAVADAWLASKTRVTPKTLAGYTTTVKLHLEPLRPIEVGKLTPGLVQDWIDGLDGSPKTVRNAASILHSIMGRAVRDRLIQANPCDGLELPKVSEGERRYLTAAQVESLAHHSGRPTLVNTLAYTGMRWGELAALQVSDVDAKARRIRVRRSVTEVSGTLHWGETKGRKVRRIPVSPFLADQLRFAVKDKDPDDLVFTAPRGGVLRYRNARRWWDAAVVKADVPEGLTPHEMRHTCASLAIRAGANIKVLQEMLGHESAALTLDRYGHLYDDDLDAIADALEDLRTRECGQNVGTAAG